MFEQPDAVKAAKAEAREAAELAAARAASKAAHALLAEVDEQVKADPPAVEFLPVAAEAPADDGDDDGGDDDDDDVDTNFRKELS